jgi:hypothetical protein
VALVYLQGVCPESVVDMTLDGGWGTRHTTLVWNVAGDSASAALDALSAGTSTWGILFWIPLMSGSDDPAVLARWHEFASRVDNNRIRADLLRIALVFAELAGRLAVWSDAMKEWTMIESQLVLAWTADARRESDLTARREFLLTTLKERFAIPLPEEVVAVINQQVSVEMLRDWFRAALHVPSLDAFLAVLRR